MSPERICRECDGDGMIVTHVTEYRGWNNIIEPIEHEEPCERCGGTGLEGDDEAV